MRIETERLVLRPWEERDRAPFAALSQDRDVMAFLKPMDTQALSDAWIDRQIGFQAADGFCFWAVEAKAGGFVGSVGLIRVAFEAAFTPAIEVGWRIARPFWGAGYAPEAAAASLRFGFETLELAEIVANTVPRNANSRRVMEKLGMTYDPADDYDDPRAAEGDPLRRKVLYRLPRARWQR